MIHVEEIFWPKIVDQKEGEKSESRDNETHARTSLNHQLKNLVRVPIRREYTFGSAHHRYEN